MYSVYDNVTDIDLYRAYQLRNECSWLSLYIRNPMYLLSQGLLTLAEIKAPLPANCSLEVSSLSDLLALTQ